MQREAEVHSRLAEVYDPELDRPLTELGFIGGMTIEGSTVSVTFRLPTYFCSANFAYMMAADIRDRVSELPWVTDVSVALMDHFASDEINHGVNGGQSFTETFPGLAAGELAELRETFRIKAFIARQERLLRHLLNKGLSNEQIVGLSLGEVYAMLLHDTEGAALYGRYSEIRQERGHSLDPDSPAFTEVDGRPFEASKFHSYLQSARSVRLNMDFNTSLCHGLLQTRYATLNGGVTK